MNLKNIHLFTREDQKKRKQILEGSRRLRKPEGMRRGKRVVVGRPIEDACELSHSALYNNSPDPACCCCILPRGGTDPATLEALACRDGLALAMDLYLQRLHVASDCLNVVNDIGAGTGGI